MFEELDKFSNKVASQIIEKFPQWEQHAGVDEYKGEKAFLVKIPSPSSESDNSLRIDTYRDEVTVTFDAYHAHFDEFEDPDDADALSLVNQIISDEMIVVSYWRDEQWCGSLPVDKNELPSTNEEYPYANLIKIRSWSGRYNNEITCTPKN